MTVGSASHLDAVVGESHALRMVSQLRPLVTRSLIAEHEQAPRGQHSDALRRVFTYLGGLPVDGKLIVEHDGAGSWYVCRLIGAPPARADRVDGPFGTEDAAMHDVFVRRLCEHLGWHDGLDEVA